MGPSQSSDSGRHDTFIPEMRVVLHYTHILMIEKPATSQIDHARIPPVFLLANLNHR